MDLPWDDERTKQFVTNVGLITSNGPYGHDIMACEWTHQVSYSPGLIAISIMKNDTTYANIAKSKEFGVSLCADGQNVISSVSGGFSGKKINKIEALKELGFGFFRARKINALMVKGAAMNAECRLVKKIRLGDHVTLVGEVVELHHAAGKKPLAYHSQKYWKLERNIKKPRQQKLDRIKKIIEMHKK